MMSRRAFLRMMPAAAAAPLVPAAGRAGMATVGEHAAQLVHFGAISPNEARMIERRVFTYDEIHRLRPPGYWQRALKAVEDARRARRKGTPGNPCRALAAAPERGVVGSGDELHDSLSRSGAAVGPDAGPAIGGVAKHRILPPLGDADVAARSEADGQDHDRNDSHSGSPFNERQSFALPASEAEGGPSAAVFRISLKPHAGGAERAAGGLLGSGNEFTPGRRLPPPALCGPGTNFEEIGVDAAPVAARPERCVDFGSDGSHALNLHEEPYPCPRSGLPEQFGGRQ